MHSEWKLSSDEATVHPAPIHGHPVFLRFAPHIAIDGGRQITAFPLDINRWSVLDDV